MLDVLTHPKIPVEVDPPISLEVAGQRLTLFFNTESQLDLMLHDIRSASRRVWLETYIFLDDRVGRLIAEALKERALAGVDVRVHYDAVGCLVSPSRLFTDLATAGVKLHCFHSAWECLRRFTFFRTYNRRNHRKLLIIDDQAAYFGGMNIADHSCELPRHSETRSAAAIGWRDLHVRLEGPLQAEIAKSFVASWKRSLRKIRRSRESTPLKRQLALDRLRQQEFQHVPNRDEWIQFFDSGSGPRSHRSARLFMRLINAARRRLTLSMAYFLPVGRVRRAIFRCAKRGVRVRLVVPRVSDVPLVHRATRYLYHTLLRHHIEIYERSECMLHSKVLIVDDEYGVLGSSNFDVRSLWMNWEFLAVIRSRRLAATLSDVVQREIQSSCRVTHDDWRNQPWWRRWLDRLAWSLRRWL